MTVILGCLNLCKHVWLSDSTDTSQFSSFSHSSVMNVADFHDSQSAVYCKSLTTVLNSFRSSRMGSVSSTSDALAPLSPVYVSLLQNRFHAKTSCCWMNSLLAQSSSCIRSRRSLSAAVCSGYFLCLMLRDSPRRHQSRLSCQVCHRVLFPSPRLYSCFCG